MAADDGRPNRGAYGTWTPATEDAPGAVTSNLGGMEFVLEEDAPGHRDCVTKAIRGGTSVRRRMVVPARGPQGWRRMTGGQAGITASGRMDPAAEDAAMRLHLSRSIRGGSAVRRRMVGRPGRSLSCTWTPAAEDAQRGQQPAHGDSNDRWRQSPPAAEAGRPDRGAIQHMDARGRGHWQRWLSPGSCVRRRRTGGQEGGLRHMDARSRGRRS